MILSSSDEGSTLPWPTMHTWLPDSLLELILESEKLVFGWYCLELEILLEKEVLAGGLRG